MTSFELNCVSSVPLTLFRSSFARLPVTDRLGNQAFSEIRTPWPRDLTVCFADFILGCSSKIRATCSRNDRLSAIALLTGRQTRAVVPKIINTTMRWIIKKLLHVIAIKELNKYRYSTVLLGHNHYLSLSERLICPFPERLNKVVNNPPLSRENSAFDALTGSQLVGFSIV